MATIPENLSSLLLALSASPIEDPARTTLQSHVSHFSTLVSWATAIVAVGVALEGVEIVHDIVAWAKRKRREKRERSDLKEIACIFPAGEVRGDKNTHSDHPRWVKRVLRLGLVAVVVGVVGEWRCGAKLEDAHNAVHEYDLAKLTAADQKAVNAQQSVDAVAATAKQLLGQYTAAEADLIELKAEKLPRRLSSDQKAIFRKAVISFAPRRLDIGCFGDQGEVHDFEGDFLGALGLSPSRTCASVTGVTISVPPIQIDIGADRKHDAEILLAALKEMGIKKEQIITKPDNNRELLVLIVGPKAP